MGSVTESVDVAVPVSTAYNQWTQVEEFSQFMEGVSQVTQLTPTRTHWVIEIAGVQREFDAEITEQHPDERVAWRSLMGPNHAGAVTFDRLDEKHSRVTVQVQMSPGGLTEKAADVLGIVNRRIRGDLKRFKDFIETRGSETGAWRGDVERPQP